MNARQYCKDSSAEQRPRLANESGRFVIRAKWVSVTLMMTIVGCAPGAVVEQSLVGAGQPPMKLVERRNLGLPNSGPGNRFVSGWFFEEHEGGFTAKPVESRARLEIVQLDARPRTLSLHTRSDPRGWRVTAEVGSRALETRATPSGIEIPLPGDLSPGRSLIDLEFADSERVRISGASVSAVVGAGRVEIEAEDLVHSSWSVVDFVLDVVPGSFLLGEFDPPPDPRPGQRFAISLQREGEMPTMVFETRPGEQANPGSENFEIPFGQSPTVRLRLSAEGKGPAGRWRGLRVRTRLQDSPERKSTPAHAPRVIVLYVMDALRADEVGHLGGEAGATPCMDRLAAEGAVFANHFSVAPNTGPATASLFTGYGFLRGRSIPENRVPTLAGDFVGAGFRTVAISSNPHLSPSFGLTRGFDDVLFVPIEEDHDASAPPTVNDSAGRVHRAAMEWLDGASPGQSLFLYLHTLNPHNPYNPPEPFPSNFLRTAGSTIDASTRVLASIRDGRRKVSLDDQERIREWYTAGVSYNDAALCGFLEKLRTRFGKQLLVVVTSDHGEELFDHGGVLHGHTLYDELLHVPLVMWWPDRIGRAVYENATGTLDLTATLRAMIGARAEVRDGGRSLWPLMNGEAGESDGPSLHFATAPGLRRAAMIRSDRWKLIFVPRPRFGWGMGRGDSRTHDAEYVFDMLGDPEERTNLAGSNRLEVDRLRARLTTWLNAWEARQPDRKEEPLDNETRRRLKALGYTD